MKKYTCLFFSFLFLNLFIAQSKTDDFILSDFTQGSTVIKRKGYEVSYDTSRLVTNWVMYLHTKSKRIKIVNRKNKFYNDTLVPNINFNDNYIYSVFDRGHLAPAGDMTYNDTAMLTSFIYSNIAPQVPSFNRGVWSRLEEKVRGWVDDYDSLIIITGPIMKESDTLFK